MSRETGSGKENRNRGSDGIPRSIVFIYTVRREPVACYTNQERTIRASFAVPALHSVTLRILNLRFAEAVPVNWERVPLAAIEVLGLPRLDLSVGGVDKRYAGSDPVEE